MLILNLLISEYLDQILPWKAFLVKLQTENFFLLKVKIKQSTGCPNKDYNLIFEHENDWENIIAYWEESEQSKVYVNMCGLFRIQLGVWRDGATPGKF